MMTLLKGRILVIKIRGVIDEMYVFIMSDNNNYTDLIPSNLPIKQVSKARNNDVLFRNQVVTQALYDMGPSHNCISENLLREIKIRCFKVIST